MLHLFSSFLEHPVARAYFSRIRKIRRKGLGSQSFSPRGPRMRRSIATRPQAGKIFASQVKAGVTRFLEKIGGTAEILRHTAAVLVQ
jgi:hypothetical protein